jgi:hypothetical protein
MKDESYQVALINIGKLRKIGFSWIILYSSTNSCGGHKFFSTVKTAV